MNVFLQDHGSLPNLANEVSAEQQRDRNKVHETVPLLLHICTIEN
jgi:hypothetical protein